jgi:uncharacterized NAD(P)/FAD-binding protein YdhS
MARVTWRRRRDGMTRTLTLGRVIDCTGPEGDLTQTLNTIVRSLLGGERWRR